MARWHGGARFAWPRIHHAPLLLLQPQLRVRAAALRAMAVITARCSQNPATQQTDPHINHAQGRPTCTRCDANRSRQRLSAAAADQGLSNNAQAAGSRPLHRGKTASSRQGRLCAPFTHGRPGRPLSHMHRTAPPPLSRGGTRMKGGLQHTGPRSGLLAAPRQAAASRMVHAPRPECSALGGPFLGRRHAW